MLKSKSSISKICNSRMELDFSDSNSNHDSISANDYDSPSLPSCRRHDGTVHIQVHRASVPTLIEYSSCLNSLKLLADLVDLGLRDLERDLQHLVVDGRHGLEQRRGDHLRVGVLAVEEPERQRGAVAHVELEVH